MPDVKISQLPAVTTPTTADLVPIVQSAVTDYITRGNFLKNIDADATLTDITTNNVTSTKHGFAPKSPADATKFLNGAATPAFAQVNGSDLSLTDVTTNNVSSTKHGFAPKSPADATQFLNGATTPAFAQVKDSDLSTSDITTNDASTTKHGFILKATAPSSGIRNVVAIDNGETVYKNTALLDNTNPADPGTASPGTSLIAARRDHVHNSQSITDAIEFVIDGGGSVITTGMKGYVEVPYACTITQATLLADQSGSIVVNVYKCSYANFDAGSTHPVSGDKITASAPPTISSATKAQDSTLTGWTTSVSAGDILAFKVDSVTTCTRVTISLKITR